MPSALPSFWPSGNGQGGRAASPQQIHYIYIYILLPLRLLLLPHLLLLPLLPLHYYYYYYYYYCCCDWLRKHDFFGLSDKANERKKRQHNTTISTTAPTR